MWRINNGGPFKIPPMRETLPCSQLRTPNRREFLARARMVAAVLGRPAVASAQGARMRLILLGTGGGPRPRKVSSAPAQVIVCGGAAYVIDCGDGVARQLVVKGGEK